MFNQVPGKPDGLKTPQALWRDRPGTVAGVPACYQLAAFCTAECWRRMDRKRYALIAAGAIESGTVAYARIRSGASLVQLFTAMVYEGPLLARRIARDLALLLARDGFASVADAVGADLSTSAVAM